MRRSLWWLIIAAVLAIFFGIVGRASGIGAFTSVSGLLWMVAIVAGIIAIPIWHRILPDVPAMEGLFKRPLSEERWCVGCGTPTVADQPCHICGKAPRPPKPEKPPKQPKAPRGTAKTGSKPAAKAKGGGTSRP